MKRNFDAARARRAIRLSCLGAIALALAFLGSGAAEAVAGAVTTPAALGMGSAYSAVARNWEAAHLNPANLGLGGNADLSVHLLSLSGEVSNNGFTLLGDYGDVLTDDEKQEILGRIGADGLALRAAGEFAGLSATYRRYALTMTTTAHLDGGLPRDLVELLLYGNELDRTYDVGSATGETAVLTSIGLSASYPLVIDALAPYVGELAVGGTVRYVKGWYYAHVREAYGTLTTSIDGASGDAAFTLRTAEGGSGYGVDLAAAATRGSVSFGLTLQDLLGSMTWTGAEDERRTFAADSLTAENLEDEDDPIVETEETVPVGDFEVRVPPAVRLGVAWDRGRWMLAGDLVQGWGGDGLRPAGTRLATGARYALVPWLNLRGGIRFEERRPASWSGGLGLALASTRLDLAVVSGGGLTLGQDEGFGMALGFGMVWD